MSIESSIDNRLAEALKRSTADYAEIRIESTDSTSIVFRGKDPDHVSSSRLTGGIVRACKNDGWGTVVFDSLENLGDRVAEACAWAALVGKGKTALREPPSCEREILATMTNDFRNITLDSKISMVSHYNDLLLAAEGVATSSVAYSDSFRTVHFASTAGTRFLEERPLLRFHFNATAKKANMVQKAGDSVSSTHDYGVMENLDGRVEKAARQAVDLLSARPCSGGTYTVLLDQELAGVFAHEALGHLSEADFLYENPKMRELMCRGRRMGVNALNVIDDGSMPGLLGSQQLDDEGTPSSRTYLIREGILSGHLHSMETAAKMDAAPTGNARAINRTSPPIVRMTNTYIDAGNATKQDLLSGIDRGIYACGMQGGQTMLEMFTFSAARGYMIENGHIGELVRDVVLTGNVFETLHNIDGIGNDLKILEKAGGCGKGGQAPLPVTFGAPHIRIQDVVIGGDS